MFYLLLCAWGLVFLASEISSADTCSDDFEDGVIDTSLWLTGAANNGLMSPVYCKSPRKCLFIGSFDMSGKS
jgi:hypothetical protein